MDGDGAAPISSTAAALGGRAQKLLLEIARYQGITFFRPFFFFLLLDSVVGSAFVALPAVDSALVPALVPSLLVPDELAAAGGVAADTVADGTADGVASGFEFAG